MAVCAPVAFFLDGVGRFLLYCRRVCPCSGHFRDSMLDGMRANDVRTGRPSRITDRCSCRSRVEGEESIFVLFCRFSVSFKMQRVCFVVKTEETQSMWRRKIEKKKS